jgi:transcription antitermination protein NusB
MKSRRRAREAALQALYQCDTLQDWSAEAVDLYFKVFQSESSPIAEDSSQENHDFARALIGGVIEHLSEIDDQISSASTRWSIGRMSRVDRNILRLASYEIAFVPDIPVNVSINEAIEIAKRYGTDDSPMFINGVLDNVASLWAPAVKREQSAAGAPAKKAASGGG